MSQTLRQALIAIAGISALVFIFGMMSWPVELRTALKLIPCTAMAALVFGGAKGRGSRLIGAGLGLSVLGDGLLEWSAELFVPGLLAFLTAHLLYIGGLSRAWPELRPLRALGPLAFAGGVFTFIAPGLGPMAAPVAVYSLVIAGMLWRASVGLGRPGTDRALAWIAFAGAASFVLSDGILAINKFHSPLPFARYLNMSTYWGGQALLCAAALRLPAGPGAAAR